MFLGAYTVMAEGGVVTMPERFNLVNSECRVVIYTETVQQTQIKILSIYPKDLHQEIDTPDNICEQYDTKITDGKFALPESFANYLQGEELEIYGLMNNIEIIKKSDAELMDFSFSPELADADSFKEIFDKLIEDGNK